MKPVSEMSPNTRFTGDRTLPKWVVLGILVLLHFWGGLVTIVRKSYGPKYFVGGHQEC